MTNKILLHIGERPQRYPGSCADGNGRHGAFQWVQVSYWEAVIRLVADDHSFWMIGNS